MKCLLGNGLPSSLTPERVKEVLRFVKSQEREFREALDHSKHPVWTRNKSSRGFYECIHKLLRTKEGREAYDKARVDFERNKPKRSERANIFRLLANDCVKKISDQEALAAILDDDRGGVEKEQDVKELFAREGAWGYMAEFIWALSIRDNIGDDIVGAIQEYPKLLPFLKEVQAGLDFTNESATESVENPPSREDEEATILVESIKELIASLDPERLELTALDDLDHAVQRLRMIADSREGRRHHIQHLQEYLSSWRESHSEAIAITPGVENHLIELEARLVGFGDFDHDWLKSVLDYYEKALDTQIRVRDIRAEYQRAIDEDDLTLVSTLAGRLKESQHELERAYTAIDSVDLVGSLKEEKEEEQAPDSLKAASQEETGDSEDEDEGAVLSGDDSGTLEETPDRISEEDDTATIGISIPDPETSGDMDDKGLRQLMHEEVVDLYIEKISNVVITEIGRNRFGLAYHLALATPEVFPSADVIRLIACNYVTDEQAQVIACLPDLAERLIKEVETVSKRQPDQSFMCGHAALIASAALMPARIAPGEPVAELLQSLEPHLKDMPSLWTLSRTAADVSVRGLYLPSELLYEGDTADKWIEDVRIIQKEADIWIESERQAKISYQPATKVWHRILEDWEGERLASIGHMFKLLAEPTDRVNIDRVTTIANGWRDHDNVEKNIDRIDRDFRGSAAKKKIGGSARIALRGKIVEAIALGDRWRSLLEAQPDRPSSFPAKQINGLRNAVRNHAGDALDEIREIESLGSQLITKARELIQCYMASFERPEVNPSVSHMNLSDQLNGDLLADSKLDFDNRTEAPIKEVSPEIVLHLVDQTVQDFNASFKKAAIERAKRDDFQMAEKTIDFAIQRTYLDDDDAGDARNAIEDERVRAKEKLEKRIGDVRNRLDVTYTRNGLPIDDFDRLQEEISFIDSSDVDEIRSYDEMLDQINDELNEYTENMAKKIKKRLNDIKMSSHYKKRIQSLIDHGRFQVAEDYIERVERDEALPEEEEGADRLFDQFFPSFVDAYFDFEGELQSKAMDLSKIIRHRQHSGPIDASKLSVDSARDGSHLIKAWFDVHAEKKTTAKKLKELLVALGFDRRGQLLSAGTSQEAQDDAEFRFDTRTITDRRIVQLPDFGSRAGGRYRIVTIRDRDTHEAIIRKAGERKADRRSPTLVIFLNVLDVDARRSLAREFSSGTYRPTIVLDEALLVFLAALPHDRLGAFFDCASVFAFAQPFDPDAAEVPPEMFFGREKEREQIVAMEGGMTHLIYGGRRLGKTALLADIAREYQERAPNELALLLDLKSSGIGWDKSPYEFWRVLGNRLKEYKVVSPGTVRHDSIGENVKKWLDENHARRILVLADEADDFLDADRGDLQEGDQQLRQRYRVLTQIKGLMEITKRRFKVVFSGLHNVQRSARDPNTPFAHLGDPIQIGPMLPEKGDTEILDLIRGPFEALGYRFASHDSVIGIAAGTNYYPALAQQFCKELLQHLRENNRASDGEEEGPPFSIPSETVDHVFNSRETRDRIRNLFAWTIHLDPRYEFLTYLIAQQSFDDESTRPGGVSIDDIRDTALSEWYHGFESDDSYSTFEVLLEEMVGLGILREVENNSPTFQTRRFAIRTRNLRMLLGSKDQVERRYSDAKRKSPLGFDPAQFRHILEGVTLSSLTAGQEAQLLSGQSGVGLVFGTHLSGLDRVLESIKKAIKQEEEKDSVKSYRLHAVNLSSLDELLKEVLRRRAGVHVILIDARNDWNLGQINKTLDFIAGLDAQNRTIRPVFLGGPTEAWRWLNEPRPAHRPKARPREIWLGPCSKGFAWKWLKDREARAYTDLENPEYPVDPPWPVVIASAAKPSSSSLKEPPSTINEAIQFTLEAHSGLISDTLEVPQAKPALQVLSEYWGSQSMTVDLISDMSEDIGAKISPEDVSRVVNWASHLGLVHRDEEGYRLDSTYALGFRAGFKK